MQVKVNLASEASLRVTPDRRTRELTQAVDLPPGCWTVVVECPWCAVSPSREGLRTCTGSVTDGSVISGQRLTAINSGLGWSV